MVLELARPSEARCFPPAGDFFEAVLLQQPQATEAVEKCCFSRISDDTLGSCLYKRYIQMVCLGQFLVSLGFISFRIQTDENKTKELDFHVEILWDSLGFRVSYRFTSLGGFLSGFFQVSVEFHAGFASGILSVLPGSAAGAAALKSGQGPPGRGIAVRQFSPLRRREGPRPLPPTSPPPKTPAFYGVLCSSQFFSFFGSCGSRWVNMGQHRPQDGPT